MHKNKHVIITGGLGFIGKHLAKSFLSDGFYVSIGDLDLTSEILMFRWLEDLGISKNMLIIHRLDITDDNSIDIFLETILNNYASIDILINNAAIDAKFDPVNLNNINNSRFENYPFKMIENSVCVNMLGTIKISQKVIRLMVQQGFGNIINVGSIYSILAPNQNLYNNGKAKNEFCYKPIDYVVSKSFIPNFTRYLATLYGKDNIRCNAIAPHGIYDDHDETFLSNFIKISPSNRMCTIDEIYGTFKFLSTDASSYINGQTIVLDGGWSSW